MMTPLSVLNVRLQSLSIFRSLLDDPVIAALSRYLACDAPITEGALCDCRVYLLGLSCLYAVGVVVVIFYIVRL